MEPVRVKLYGLFPVTKRRYVRQLIATVVLLLVLLGLWYFLPTPQRPAGQALPPQLDWALSLLQYLPWIVLGLGVLVLLEAALVLRGFTRAEAAQRQVVTVESPARV